MKKEKNYSIVTDRLLIQNFVNLQKAITTMTVKFESLSDNITKLLQLFELSAKSFAEKNPMMRDNEKDREFLDKLNVLMEQNKVIAKGLTLMEEKLRQRIAPSFVPQRTDMQGSVKL